MTYTNDGINRRNFLRLGLGAAALTATGCSIPMREMDPYDAKVAAELRTSSLGKELTAYREQLLATWKDPKVIATPEFKAGELMAYFKAQNQTDDEAFASTEAVRKLHSMSSQAGEVLKARPRQIGAAFDAAGWGDSFLYHVASGNKDEAARKGAVKEVEKYLADTQSLANTADENVRKLDRELGDIGSYQHRITKLGTYDNETVKQILNAYKQNISSLGGHESVLYSIDVAEGLWPVILSNIDRVDGLHQALVNQSLRTGARKQLGQKVTYDKKELTLDAFAQQQGKLAKDYYADGSDNLADKVMRYARSPFMWAVLSQLTNPRDGNKRISTDDHRGLALLMDEEIAKASATSPNVAYRIFMTAADAVVTPVTLVNLVKDLSYTKLPDNGLGEVYDEKALETAVSNVIDVTNGIKDPHWYVGDKKQIGPRVLLRIVALLAQAGMWYSVARGFGSKSHDNGTTGPAESGGTFNGGNGVGPARTPQ